MNKELRARLESTQDVLGTFATGLEMPIRRAIEGRLDAVKEHWDDSDIICGNRQVELAEDRTCATGHSRSCRSNSTRFPWLTKALTAADIRRAHEAGTHAGLVSSQVMLGPWRDLDALAYAHDAGLRMSRLTYNNMTTVGVGCTERRMPACLLRSRQRQGHEQLGVIVDAGHVGRQNTLDPCEVSEAPVVASHTAAQGAYAHARGKSDEELRAIVGTGGVIGIVTVPFFLAPGPDVNINSMLDHIEYVVEGHRCRPCLYRNRLALATAEMDAQRHRQPLFADTGFRPEDGLVATQQLIGFDDYRDFPNITCGLVARGWSEEDIRQGPRRELPPRGGDRLWLTHRISVSSPLSSLHVFDSCSCFRYTSAKIDL